MNSVLMSSLSWTTYQERLRDERLVLFLPCGALEQHGPHLPLGTDALLSMAIDPSEAVQVTGPGAPVINNGYKTHPNSGGGQYFPGTTSLDGQSLSYITRDVIREFARHGVQHLVVVDGHYENQWFLTEGIDLALREIGPSSRLRIMRLEYWDFCTEETLSRVFPDGFPGFALEHAAVIETSLMLHYYPNLVHLDRIPVDDAAVFPPYDLYPPCIHWVPSSGVLSSAKAASAEKGSVIAQQVTESIAKAVVHEFMSEKLNDEG